MSFLFKLLIALIVPGAITVAVGRVVMNVWLGIIVAVGVMMAVFEGYKQGPVLMTLGLISMIIAFFITKKLLGGKTWDK
ncbi:DUF2198 family protein [Microaerobacter geothermalis]|uniref:DUF2198 family protein n=1 Tax=Microaerobacter geothermalis TaxID=674972 RepID=UPI001F26A574|nr:DUF2198 family protein [Microaerobacter geothermalis]MCF6094555.1 DUF2198 family protein [Microaerobacter geothermalis]